MDEPTQTIHADGSVLGHRFEAAQLGRAPFRFLRMVEKAMQYPDGTTQAGGTCQYCGTGIRYCYYLRSSDGKEFYVGSDCVKHLGDDKLVTVVMSAERQRKNALAAQRRQAKQAVERAYVEAHLEAYRAALTVLQNTPHPNEYFAGQGKTKADYFRYFEFGGIPNYQRLCEVLREAETIMPERPGGRGKACE